MNSIKDREKTGKWVWNGEKSGFGFFKANFVKLCFVVRCDKLCRVGNLLSTPEE